MVIGYRVGPTMCPGVLKLVVKFSKAF